MRRLRAFDGLVWAATAFIGLAFAFLFSYRFVLHHFVIGPYLWDSGWISAAIFQKPSAFAACLGLGLNSR